MSIFAGFDPMRNSRSRERKRREKQRRQFWMGSVIVVWFILVLAICIGAMIGICHWLGML